MTVKVIDIDETGRVRLSRKAVIMEAPDYDPAQYEGMEMAMAGGGEGGERDRGATAAVTAVDAAATGGRRGGGDRGGPRRPRRRRRRTPLRPPSFDV